MPVYKIKSFWIAACFFVLLFAFLLAIRLGLPDKLFPGHPPDNRIDPVSNGSSSLKLENDAWMNIFQNNRKIGYTHSTFSRQKHGFTLKEVVFMRINTMGKIQDLNIHTRGKLNSDFSLSSFEFEISSGIFSFSAKGTVSGDILSVTTQSAGEVRSNDINLKKKPYLTAGILNTIGMSDIDPGKKYIYDIFDPATMGQEPLKITILNTEDLRIMGSTLKATKILMDFKGATQLAWIDEHGEILKEEGLLGITLLKTTPEDARSNLGIQASDDLVKFASIISNVQLDKTDGLNKLEVAISGIDLNNTHLNGERQVLHGNILTIRKESLQGLPLSFYTDDLTNFLKPSPFIQSDHQKIRAIANKIVSNKDTPLEKAKKLLFWIHKNIEKKPVVSLPDALSTLENRMGDCNEHAVLMAA
ncbi:MAG: transglutaminase-like domain-containing protein, partial [Desulfobacterales bacterium]|nr:transglutaminase-like domain-containing protein [Desulfobacterales bacterium]